MLFFVFRFMVCVYHRWLLAPYSASTTHRSFISSSGRLRIRSRGDSSRLQKEFDDFASTLSMYCTALNLRSTSICTAPILSTLVTECCELVVDAGDSCAEAAVDMRVEQSKG